MCRDPDKDRSFEESFRPVGDILPEVIRSLRLEERLTVSQVERTWAALVGPGVAQHARPTRLTRAALMVQVLQPSVRYALEGRRNELLRILQTRFGADRIRSIRFVTS
jgi:predicted nucleic acid-binding Zn ribbon protein